MNVKWMAGEISCVTFPHKVSDVEATHLQVEAQYKAV